MTADVLTVQNLTKSYGDVRAVNGLSFSVRRGEIFGFLGPNGAGKTTTLSMIEGIRIPDEGAIHLFGLDMRQDSAQIKRRIGVQLQSTSLLADLTALEQVELFGRLYGRAINRPTALTLLEQVGLSEKAHTLPVKMSGGQHQRLALALALVNDPEIVFLDEPTAGLDPQARRALWELIRKLRDEGRTIILTTHYMEEAEALSHRIAIINHGELLALDTPGALIAQLQGLSTITITAPLPAEACQQLPGVQSLTQEGDLLRLQTNDIPGTIAALLDLAKTQGIALTDLHVQQPSLEDVFLHLTGRNIRN
ncbi:MAG: ABC transporter ATP-binding protein [Anaerolineales bacterium]